MIESETGPSQSYDIEPKISESIKKSEQFDRDDDDDNLVNEVADEDL